jgi:hypothetical protein
MENRSQRHPSGVEILLFYQPLGILFLAEPLQFFAPRLVFAILSVLLYGSFMFVFTIEVLSSHGIKLRLPGILPSGLHRASETEHVAPNTFGYGVEGLPMNLEAGRFFLFVHGMITSVLSWHDKPPSRRDHVNPGCYQNPPNPDIVGFGVRYSIYILLFCIFISLFVGSFHRQQSGTKELGCMVLISR